MRQGWTKHTVTVYWIQWTTVVVEEVAEYMGMHSVICVLVLF